MFLLNKYYLDLSKALTRAREFLTWLECPNIATGTGAVIWRRAVSSVDPS